MSSTANSPDRYLDLKGLKCPLPVLKARRAIKDMSTGQVLEVRADDPAAQLDFPHFCETQGHALITADRDATTGELTFRIKVG
ncbi:MAG: sulfurtransferase TusA family protein [Alphaproteobacteria bacterium]|nr:sulfurtransferase TusA family protein [Alphaproteobacteria bacterium]